MREDLPGSMGTDRPVGGTDSDKNGEGKASARLGGKLLHLELLKFGGFEIPETYRAETIDIGKLVPGNLYVVRSSAGSEDSMDETAAGKYTSILSLKREEIAKAVETVRSGYEKGSVVIQPDLTMKMLYSGVMYTNLNGEMVISIGKGAAVQKIVRGEGVQTRITFHDGKYSIDGGYISPAVMGKVRDQGLAVESFFRRPMDIEFAFIGDRVVLLQARPLPSPTDTALREAEIRKAKNVLSGLGAIGVEDIVLGVGNCREILGDSAATQLSVSTFNYVFAGDGKGLMGAIQLGRNELGYDIGREIFPSVVMVGGKVYYNFAGDALQFRPKGIKLEQLVETINCVYAPRARANPDLLNYPELRLYVQFPEQAMEVGLNPEPYRKLAEKNRKAIHRLRMPERAPTRQAIRNFTGAAECLAEIKCRADALRKGSAREYVKAARLAFFAMEDVRIGLERIRAADHCGFELLSKSFSASDPVKLRDAIVYSQSIASFEVQKTEDFRYQGSFELSLPRGFPPDRSFKQGAGIGDPVLLEKVEMARKALEYREKVKFFLLRDYDVLGQLYTAYGDLVGIGANVYKLDFDDLHLAMDAPTLAEYRIRSSDEAKSRTAFGDPIFGFESAGGGPGFAAGKPELIFGAIAEGGHEFIIGSSAQVIRAVDPTVVLPNGTRLIIVPSNIRPGSHLFTVLSDKGLPVITVPDGILGKLEAGKGVNLMRKGDKIELVCG